MVLKLLSRFWNRYRPHEGWLPFFLLLAAVACLVAAVAEVGWVREAGVVGWAAGLGLLLGAVLAKRPLSRWPAWTLLTLYGLLITLVDVGRFWPPLSVLAGGRAALADYWLQQGALLFDRVAGWSQAVFSGGTSRETVVFALALGLSAWFLAAYAAWSTFRQQRPLLGLTLMGLALAANSYFGGAPVWYAAIFTGLVATIAAAMQYATLEKGWQRRGVDYSGEIRLDLLLHAAGIALVLLTLAMLLPNMPYSSVARGFARLPAVRQAEETFERLFAGVRQPAQRPTAAGNPGVWPRAFLLGNPPELGETVMMTATVAGPIPATGGHWRGVSYDIYTGRGWDLSDERAADLAAGVPLPLPEVRESITVSQSVHWLYDRRAIRYTLGLPLSFDQDTTTYWRGLSDLSRVGGAGTIYHATSRLTAATPAALRQTTASDIPAALYARYTALPPTVPDRVADQAEQIAGNLRNPYDQARALETFLRQYPYSLDVALPPADRDPVDYFLFELQTGYCDYYASAMVVMARSLGLPARLATGFLAQPPDARGIQTIYELNAHAWAEIYFAGYGWIEFEPTAPFATTSAGAGSEPAGGAGDETAVTPPIPAATRERRWTLLLLLLLPFLLLAAWIWRRQRPARDADPILWAYGRLLNSARHLGQPTPPSQTPAEFQSLLLDRLAALDRDRPPAWVPVEPANLRPDIEQLIALFIGRQYGGRSQRGEQTARQIWSKLRRPLWWLGWVAKLTGTGDKRG